MVADLREMQENQWVSEIRIDKLEFDENRAVLRYRGRHVTGEAVHCNLSEPRKPQSHHGIRTDFLLPPGRLRYGFAEYKNSLRILQSLKRCRCLIGGEFQHVHLEFPIL